MSHIHDAATRNEMPRLPWPNSLGFRAASNALVSCTLSRLSTTNSKISLPQRNSPTSDTKSPHVRFIQTITNLPIDLRHTPHRELCKSESSSQLSLILSDLHHRHRRRNDGSRAIEAIDRGPASFVVARGGRRAAGGEGGHTRIKS